MLKSETLRQNLGANVRRLREAKGWTQRELAELVGVHHININRIECGRHSPSSELLYQLADVLNVSTDSLRQTAMIPDEDVKKPARKRA